MLLYHPAIDFYHCWMRFASILCDCTVGGLEYERLRIVDFLLCFPKEIENCSWPRDLSSEIRRASRQLPQSYEEPNSVRQAFIQMSKVHQQVIMDMLSRGLTERNAYLEGVISPVTSGPKKSLFKTVAAEWSLREADWYQLLLRTALSMPLNGDGGLKCRTGLLEYRYDV